MTIPEKMIMAHLDNLLTSSEPGSDLHHLHVVMAPAAAIGPLGLPAEDQLHSTVYAIAADTPEAGESVERFLAKVIISAGVEAVNKGDVPLFAALSTEVWAVPRMDALAGKLLRSHRLQDHPDAAECTIVYGACKDGRRWRGRRWLTGAGAGTSENVDLVVGRPEPHEAFGLPVARLIRALVGLP